MAKKIQVVTERYCCQAEDLEILEPKKAINLNRWSRAYQELPRFCKHCGQEFEYYRFMDAAGSMDWDYRPVKDVT